MIEIGIQSAVSNFFKITKVLMIIIFNFLIYTEKL